MIKLKPGIEKELTFDISFRGINLQKAESRVLIPISEIFVIKANGQFINDNQILVKIPPIPSNIKDNLNEITTKAVLEIITQDGRYFKPYETEVVLVEEPKITNITLKENETELSEKQHIKVKKVKVRKEIKEPKFIKKETKKSKKEESKFRKFVNGDITI